ncbi:hypothetical protein PISL3812_04774 [Talaromyces islandicus]|uniref:Uncharacterized protein n=1 Tax=Talaromyces islandicus TaxID=28573 RepID=A0A0U1LWH3_TALIS|nr:hypothetical protein PISL3812_04774 [Talaromyces islandicus]
MGRHSLRSPFPISPRSSSIQAETNYDGRSVSRMRSHESVMGDRNGKAHRVLGGYSTNPRYLDREGSINGTVDSSVDDRYSMTSSTIDRDSIASSVPQHELRVRASSPLLGRNYHTHQHALKNHPPPELPQIPQSGSWSDIMASKPDPYAFETQSQHSLAYGVVEDMKGIRFPNLASDPPPLQQRPQLQTQEPSKEAKKKRPSRIDLSLLFPKPKPVAAPLLSPQRLTNSPSPVPSEASVARKVAPARMMKYRSGSNRKQADSAIPEESLPVPSQSRKTMDWFDIPVERTIRVDNVAPSDYADDEELSPTMAFRSTPEVRQPQPQRAPSQKDVNFSQPMSVRSSRRSSLTSGTSRASRHTSRSIESHASPQPTPPSDKIRNSLQAWQSEGDLRSKRSHGRLSKKSSSSTLTAFDLSKTSVLSLSSSEDEDESEDAREDDAKYGESLVKGATLPRMLRASISTYDGFEPEICTAEAVVTTRGHPLTQFNRTAPLNRSYSKMSTDSSDSRRTVRRASGRSRESSLSSVGRSASNRRLESRTSTRVPLIEEQEELADVHEENEESSPIPLPVPASNSSTQSSKRRSRIIAVTRQEESLLEAMRQRNGRFTPSIFHEVTSATGTDSDTDSNRRPSPNPRMQEATPQPSYDTSFLRLSTAMFPSPGSQSPSGEGAISKEKEAFMSLSSTSDSEQRTESNSTASPRLSLAYSTHSSSSTTGYTSPMTPTLPIHRFSPRAPPPSHAPPPIPESARRHSRRRTDSSEAIIVDDSANGKDTDAEIPIWAIKWAPDSVDLAVAH